MQEKAADTARKSKGNAERALRKAEKALEALLKKDGQSTVGAEAKVRRAQALLATVKSNKASRDGQFTLRRQVRASLRVARDAKCNCNCSSTRCRG